MPQSDVCLFTPGGTLVLPSLTGPGLAGKNNMLLPTPKTLRIAEELAQRGFEVNLDGGNIKVSPPMSPTLNAFSPRSRSQSSLSFIPHNSRMGTFTESNAVKSTRPRFNSARHREQAQHANSGARSSKPPVCSPLLPPSISPPHTPTGPTSPSLGSVRAQRNALHALRTSAPAALGATTVIKARGSLTAADTEELLRVSSPVVNQSRGCDGPTTGSPVDCLPSRPSTSMSGQFGDSLLRTRQYPGSNHPMAMHKPTRGQAFIVFSEMDKDKNGKLTYSEFEDACVSLGMSETQTHSIFSKLDKRKRGFIDAHDWGGEGVQLMVEALTQMYMLRHMGFPGITATREQVKKYFWQQHTRAVNNLNAAVQLAYSNSLLRQANNPSRHGSVLDAFRFVDVGHTGTLSREEVRDAFLGLGVVVSDALCQQVMQAFDKEGRGRINYSEFVGVMFSGRPT